MNQETKKGSLKSIDPIAQNIRYLIRKLIQKNI